MRALLSPKTLFPVLLLASPGLGQDCSTAVVLDPCGGQITSPLTASPPGTPCGGVFSAWSRITPSRSGPVTLRNYNGLDGVLAVHTGDCGSLTLIQCGPAGGETPQVLDAVAGTTYYIQAVGFGAMPRVHVGVTDPNCVANDTSECLQAQPIGSCGGESYPYNTALGLDLATQCGGNPPGTAEGNVWYEIVPVADGLLDLDVVMLGGSGFNVGITIFGGDCSNLVELACGDANAGGAFAPVVAGNRYTIRLRAVLGDTFGDLVVAPIGGAAPCLPCTDCDADGFDMGIDCDDARASVYPGAPEIMGDGIDNDCDGIVDNCTDCDGDGYAAPLDCDDTNPNVNPGMPEIQGNGIDDDCDGNIDEPGFQMPSPITSPLRRY